LHRLADMGAVIIDVWALDDDAHDVDEHDDDRESSRPTTPSSDDPFDRFDRATSPGEPPPDVLRAATGAPPPRRARPS
jgi:hypothetical protein